MHVLCILLSRLLLICPQGLWKASKLTYPFLSDDSFVLDNRTKRHFYSFYSSFIVQKRFRYLNCHFYVLLSLFYQVICLTYLESSGKSLYHLRIVSCFLLYSFLTVPCHIPYLVVWYTATFGWIYYTQLQLRVTLNVEP